GVVSFDLLRRPGHSHQVGDPFTSYQSGVSPPATRGPGRPRSARTARPWPAVTTEARCDCGTWPPATRSATTPAATPRRPGRWYSARTATPWPAAAPMARSSCGMWPPTARSEALSPATPTLPIQWRSARTARPWAAAAPTARCKCGTWLTPWTSCNNYAPRQDDPSHELYGHSRCRQARRIEECALEHQAASLHVRAPSRAPVFRHPMAAPACG